MSVEPCNDARVREAAEILRSGGLVAFPTETVYGLGADATNAAAVRRIYSAKGRPATNPLIVHVSDAAVARHHARQWPDAAQVLADRFWPGPLTLVVPKSDAIVPDVTAGLDSVGLRAPDHPVAQQLLRAFDGPVAAPSANRANRVSPTTAEHVRAELGDAVDLILDGGPCIVGIESTVLDLTRTPPIILRPGAVTADQISALIGRVESFSGALKSNQAAHSPGQQPVHYSPAAPAFRFDPEHDAARVAAWLRRIPAKRTAFLLLECSRTTGTIKEAAGDAHRLVEMPPDAEEYARILYAALHDADAPGTAALFIELPPAGPAWTAVRDRLLRATRPIDDAFTHGT